MGNYSKIEHTPKNKFRETALSLFLIALTLASCRDVEASNGASGQNLPDKNSSETTNAGTELSETVSAIKHVTVDKEKTEEVGALYSNETAEAIENQLSSNELATTVTLEEDNKFLVTVISTVYENSLDFIGTVEESEEGIILTLTPAANSPAGSEILRVRLPIKVKGSFTEVTPGPEPPEPTEEVVEENTKVTFDVSGLTLEHPINPDCVDQFPITAESQVGSKVLCVTFDNWIQGELDNPIMLGGGYEMIAGAEGWFEQNGQKIPVIIPLVVANRKTNEIQFNGTNIGEFDEVYYLGIDKNWETHTRLRPGMKLLITINLEKMLDGSLSNNSTQGFGAEAAAYTQEDVDALFNSGDVAGFGNILWPVPNIAESP